MQALLKKIIHVLGSQSLAFVLLILLGVLTFVGTLEQQHMNLFDVQVKYFESAVLVYWVGGAVPVPMLGGYLLLTIFAANILVGGIIRMRKGLSTAGILVAHIGIVTLLVGSFVEAQFKTDGQMLLHEGESGASYQSLQEWEVVLRAVEADGTAKDYVIPEERFKGVEDGGSARFSHKTLPFDLVLTGYARNAEPRPARPHERRAGVDADGFLLQVLDDVGAESKSINVPGLTATVHPKNGGAAQRAILHGTQALPWALSFDAQQIQIHLRRRSWDLPFTIHLKRFVHKRYPGMSMAKEYSSYVTKTQDGKARDIHITMNEPLRHDGVTLYQSGWGPEGGKPGAKLYSIFSVVANPSDRVPLIACIIIAAGLLLQFLLRLFRHLEAEGRRRARLTETKEIA